MLKATVWCYDRKTELKNYLLDEYLFCAGLWSHNADHNPSPWPECEKTETTVQLLRTGLGPTVYVPVQQAWTPCCHLSWSCWTTSPVRVIVCRLYSGGCCWLLPLWPSTWVSGCTIDMWTFRLWAFSKRFPQIRHANSKSASALCLVMWYFRDARWRHWKPHTSHLGGNKSKSIYSLSTVFTSDF